MKKIFKFLGLMALAAVALTGCSDLNSASDSSSSSASSSGAYIKVVDGAESLRTIAPAYDTTFTNFTQFKLYCAPTPTDGSTITWGDSNLIKTATSSSDLTENTYSVPEGNVTFYLEATHNSQSIYTATTATKIGNGTNTVAFTLLPKEYKIGAGFIGSIDVTLAFPSKVKAVEAKLFTYDIGADPEIGQYSNGVADKTFIASSTATNKIADNSLNYTAMSVTSGIYLLKFVLYADYSTANMGVTGTPKNKISEYNEVVIVSSQGTSKATRTLTESDLEVPVYTVTYKNIDPADTTIPASVTYDNVYLRGAGYIQVPSSFTNDATVTDKIRKTQDTTVYTFDGWYTDEALTTKATLYTSSTSGTTTTYTLANAPVFTANNTYYYKTPVGGGNVTLYGKWRINITAAINNKNCTSLSYTSFSVGDIILKKTEGTTITYWQLAKKYAQFVTKAELDSWLGETTNAAYSKESVVFYVPQTTNADNTISYNANNSALGMSRVFAVNIKNSTGDSTDGTKYRWAETAAAGYNKALTSLGVACNSQVEIEGTTVYEYPTGVKYGNWKDGSTTYTALFDGESMSGSAITKLATVDDTSLQTALSALATPATPMTATYADYVSVLGNYPAFKYVMQKYNTQTAVYQTTASATGGNGSYYLPSVVQLLELYKNKDEVNAVIEKMGGNKLTKRFWSCSQDVTYSQNAWSVDFAETDPAKAALYEGDTEAGHKKNAHYFVCAITNIK